MVISSAKKDWRMVYVHKVLSNEENIQMKQEFTYYLI